MTDDELKELKVRFADGVLAQQRAQAEVQRLQRELAELARKIEEAGDGKV